MTAERPRERPADASEAPQPERATAEEAPAHGPRDREPIHRLASRALVGGLGAGAAGGVTLATTLTILLGPDLQVAGTGLLLGIGLGSAAAGLVVLEAPVRRAPRALRPPLLGLAAVPVLALLVTATLWTIGFIQGGPEKAWRDLVHQLDRGATGAEPFLLLLVALAAVGIGGARIVLAPASTARRAAARHALAGGLTGLVLAGVMVAHERWTYPQREVAGLLGLGLCFALAMAAAALGLHLGERLEARLARRLTERGA